ncbi:hypothetical protein [Alicyclobacillus dauci]|uniref:Permuted papain-like amidase enzyme, YaeF/YiiX, C92 family n=1 Tax=Alicyclobacillus dauci TaxID=1475485 RepID=A0ABY6YZD3_9BACL|nr:hypothetical protein [Alicyclobacillus dauci]WAH35060.1 hypothetical protein NZD86_12050 [Alicyclobacillus dauci]
MQTWCEPGDVLVYFKPVNLTTRLIEYGEERIDPGEDRYAYHVAIALDRYNKVEANGQATEINPIDYDRCEVFRPPYDPAKLPGALAWAHMQVGRLYGWIGIIDQGLRDISGGLLHLPRWFVTWANNRWPYCSTLAQSIMSQAGFDGVPNWPPPSPEDVYKTVKQWPVQ